MELMMTLQPFKISGGEVVAVGEIIQAENPERLISEGKARRLTHEENEKILDAYIAECENVFSIKKARKAHEQPGLWDEDKKGIR